MRENKIQDSWKLREDFFFFFFTKQLVIYKQPLFLALEYTHQVGLHEDEEGARVFPVNKIVL